MGAFLLFLTHFPFIIGLSQIPGIELNMTQVERNRLKAIETNTQFKRTGEDSVDFCSLNFYPKINLFAPHSYLPRLLFAYV